MLSSCIHPPEMSDFLYRLAYCMEISILEYIILWELLFFLVNWKTGKRGKKGKCKGLPVLLLETLAHFRKWDCLLCSLSSFLWWFHFCRSLGDILKIEFSLRFCEIYSQYKCELVSCGRVGLWLQIPKGDFIFSFNTFWDKYVFSVLLGGPRLMQGEDVYFRIPCLAWFQAVSPFFTPLLKSEQKLTQILGQKALWDS